MNLHIIKRLLNLENKNDSLYMVGKLPGPYMFKALFFSFHVAAEKRRERRWTPLAHAYVDKISKKIMIHFGKKDIILIKYCD